MADIEDHAANFTAANVTVLPIVMNTADQINADIATNNCQDTVPHRYQRRGVAGLRHPGQGHARRPARP